MLKKVLFYLLGLSLIVVSSFNYPQPTQAAGNLENAHDIISSISTGEPQVGHQITFTLPASSQQIRPRDWILIDMSNFNEITPPTGIVGVYGVPQFSVEGKTVRVTNITQLPGTTITLFGITARNPYSTLGFQLTISVAEYPNGDSLRNQAIVVPGESGVYISMSAFIDNPQTALSITGYTAPGSFVTLTQNDAVAGTSAADLSGKFSFYLTAIESGIKTYSVFSTDLSQRSTSTTMINVALIQGMLTEVSNVLLSPSIALDRNEIRPGDTLTISGSAKPSSLVNLYIESPLRSVSVETDNYGDYTYTVPGNQTASYTPGQYRTYSRVLDEMSQESMTSQTLNFVVLNAEQDNPEPMCLVNDEWVAADISKGDLNCDGKTNLTDFSILLFHWKTNHKVADINRDGSVDLVDFSIMMYYFRR